MVVFSGFSEAGTLVQLPTVPALVLHKPSPILLHPRIPAPNPPPSQEILLHPRTHPLRLTVIVLPNCNLTPNRHRKAAFFIGFDTNFLPQKLSILIIFSYTKIFCLDGNCDSPLENYCDSPLPNRDFPVANCDSRTPNRFS